MQGQGQTLVCKQVKSLTFIHQHEKYDYETCNYVIVILEHWMRQENCEGIL